MNEQPTIRALAERFCSTLLPETVCADNCATVQGFPNRTGTNLMTVNEAAEVLWKVFEGYGTSLVLLEVQKERNLHDEATRCQDVCASYNRIRAALQRIHDLPLGESTKSYGIAREALKQ